MAAMPPLVTVRAMTTTTAMLVGSTLTALKEPTMHPLVDDGGADRDDRFGSASGYVSRR